MAATAAQQVTTKIANGIKYLTTTYRGTEYVLRQGAFGWELSSKRLDYGGRFHMGSFKRFETISAVAAGCKAFGSADTIASLAYGI